DDRAREALPLLEKAIELEPDNAESHVALAEVYRKLRNWSAALAAADEAVRLNEKNPEAHYHRGCALARLGKSEAAIAALQRAVKLNEDLADGLAEEEDLQSLAKRPAFQKLKGEN